MEEHLEQIRDDELQRWPETQNKSSDNLRRLGGRMGGQTDEYLGDGHRWVMDAWINGLMKEYLNWKHRFSCKYSLTDGTKCAQNFPKKLSLPILVQTPPSPERDNSWSKPDHGTGAYLEHQQPDGRTEADRNHFHFWEHATATCY